LVALVRFYLPAPLKTSKKKQLGFELLFTALGMSTIDPNISDYRASSFLRACILPSCAFRFDLSKFRYDISLRNDNEDHKPDHGVEKTKRLDRRKLSADQYL
jgi:hypothetical protein